ncbi:B3 domain-containing transcription factor FUS3 [Hibiscus syriacus]|uniref:B3 domain-containing transcription factor FUS3 n=1 Tax=Hibiscus syriacus TaxID=106335 RepID=A0A6A3AZ42_HIBSY|nr:B3 domain-containing transcription factor FUS3 [Hibiscus syriacus]
MMAAAKTPSVQEKNEAFVTGEGDNYLRQSGRSGLTRDLVDVVPSFGVNRKRRMARQRRSSSTIKLLSFTSSSSTSSSSHVPSPTPSTSIIDPKRLRFLFQKELKNSDRAAEVHLPALESKEGIFIT